MLFGMVNDNLWRPTPYLQSKGMMVFYRDLVRTYLMFQYQLNLFHNWSLKNSECRTGSDQLQLAAQS